MEKFKWLVSYVTDNQDLYHEVFTSEKKMRKFVDEEIEEYKAQVFKLTPGGLVDWEDRT